MKDHYPPSAIPESYLVAPELQPEYNDVPGVELGEHANTGDYLSDAQVRDGRGAQIALIDAASGRAYTFGELADMTTRLAGILLELGLRPGERVAYRSLNTPEFLIVAIAAWKAGGVVVPTPAQARPTELQHYLEDTEPRFLFVLDRDGLLEGVVDVARANGVEHLVAIGPSSSPDLMDVWGRLEQDDPRAAPLPLVPTDSVAVIWHTGGTTGRPKACYHTHRRFLLGGLSVGRATGVQAGERWAAAAPIGHALGLIYHTLHTLLHGACAVVIDQFQRPERILEAIETHRIDTFAAITASWARLLEIVEEQPSADISSLQRAFAMWQSASSSHVRDGWRERGLELLNNFGSTAFATWVLVPRPGEEFEDTSLGRPIDGYTVLAIEPEGDGVRPVAPGALGRMAVRGPTGLTYWRRAELQARDVIDGWTLVDDMIEFDQAGNASYFGRTDFLISTAGNKVSPVEVETVLTRHPAVREAGVVGAPDPLRVEAVMAFVALEPDVLGDDELVKELQNKVKAELSPYKYPRRVAFVDALPRDAVGKVQHGMLKVWAAEAVSDAAGSPSTPLTT